MSKSFLFNGEIVPAGTPIAGVGSRGLRYGYGIFETMKFTGGHLRLASFHCDRLQQGITLLGFKPGVTFDPAFLVKEITRMIAVNQLTGDVRVRLMLSGTDGGPYTPGSDVPDVTIEVFTLADGHEDFPQSGLSVELYGDVRIAADRFSHLKSNNYLSYLLGARYATANGLDDVLLLNAAGHVCESTVSNCFVIMGEVVITPPLDAGCVAGVMRRHLLQLLPQHGIVVLERTISLADLALCEEIFLTNAITPIRWVRWYNGREYSHAKTRKIFDILKQSNL